jgi:transcriptional regulator of acetoin/glycerol metabolism
MLLETGQWPNRLPVRSEVATSWRRSILHGVDPEGFEPLHNNSIKSDGVLYRAARAVMDKLCDQLVNTCTSIVLADRNGYVIERRTMGTWLKNLFDRTGVDFGFSLDESLAGTNATGTVLEDLKPIRINGPEHFVNAFHVLTCAGAPIRHPITGQPYGVLSIACRNEDANDLLVPVAVQAAQEIEQRLYSASSRDERLLMKRFLSAEKSNRLVIALNDRMVIGNPAAARFLEDVGQALLWEHAAHVIQTGTGGIRELTLRSGEVVQVSCQAIQDGDEVVGALVETDVSGRSPSSRWPSIGSGAVPARALPGLVGRSTAWREVCEKAVVYRDRDLPLLLTGEPGVGKFAIITAVFAEDHAAGRLRVFDAALQPIEGAAAWITTLRTALREDQGVVVIRHVDALDNTAAQALCSLIDSSVLGNTRLVATAVQNGDVSNTYRPLIDRLAIATVDVPPLRERLEDIPDLLAALTQRHATETRQPRWQPDAVQTLSRLDWPTNVSQLENVVRRVLMGRRTDDRISGHDLPEDIRQLSPRRSLSPLERVELDLMMTVLRRCKGNKSEAATFLGVSRATLYRRIREYGIDLENAVF